MSQTLIQALRRLADARADAADLADELKAKKAEFEFANGQLIAEAKGAADHVATLEAEVRALGEAHYATTKEKDIAPGVTVKLFKTFTITDREQALAWAKETKLALIPESLDEKGLQKIAAVTPLPFVECSEVPKVTIATQLNAAVYADLAPATEASV